MLRARYHALHPLDLRIAQRNFNKGLLLQLVCLGGPRRRAGRGRALHAKHLSSARKPAQARHHEGKRAHVGRLFLHPDNLASIRVGVDCGYQLRFGPRDKAVRAKMMPMPTFWRFLRSERSS